MIDKRVTIGLVSFILLLIVFDALQQKYYLETFNLIPEGERITFLLLFKGHLYRWLVWAFVGLALGMSMFYDRGDEAVNIKKSIASILLAIFLSITIVSTFEMEVRGLDWNLQNFNELLVFFTFQKGLTFFLAFCALVLILRNVINSKRLNDQEVEIQNLKNTSLDLSRKLSAQESESAPFLTIKTGNQMNPIPISKVVWIQSDDYCVKVHTADRSFTMRKSLKQLAEQLKPYHFVRVHRQALLNMEFIEKVNFEKATAQLTNEDQVPLSKSGAVNLKKELQQSTLDRQ